MTGPDTSRDDADGRLLDAMLDELSDSASDARDRRIAGVMRAIDPPATRRPRWPTRWAAAAALLIAATLVWVYLPPNPAAAALQQIIAAASSAGDHVYIITTEMSGDRPGGPTPGSPPGPKRIGPTVRQLSTDTPPPGGAILYVRGADQYVLVRQLLDGRTLVTGSDGRQSWSVAPDDPVLVTTDPLAFRGPLPGLQTRVPFIDIRTGLEQLRSGYDVEVMDPWTRRGRDPKVFQRLRADRRTSDPEDPQLIHVWYDGDSGVVQQIQFDGMSRRDYPRLTRLTAELVDQPTLPVGFFDHRAHHDPAREVRTVDHVTR